MEGLFYIQEEWEGLDQKPTPNGIAIIDDKAKFVISMNYLSPIPNWDDLSDYTLIQGIVTTENVNVSLLDYDGLNNTDKITSQIEWISSGHVAAWDCKNFIFPNGQNGYLGAAGEWAIAMDINYRDNSNIVDNLMILIGGQTIKTATYSWSSTQKNRYNSWYYTTQFGPSQSNFIKDGSKSDGGSVRPLLAL